MMHVLGKLGARTGECFSSAEEVMCLSTSLSCLSGDLFKCHGGIKRPGFPSPLSNSSYSAGNITTILSR